VRGGLCSVRLWLRLIWKPLSWSAWCVFNDAERDRFWFVTSGLGLSVQAPVRLVLRTALVIGTHASSRARSGIKQCGMFCCGRLRLVAARRVWLRHGTSRKVQDRHVQAWSVEFCKPLSWSASVRLRASRSGMNQGEVSRVPLRCVMFRRGRSRQVLPSRENHLHGRRGSRFDAARWDVPRFGRSRRVDACRCMAVCAEETTIVQERRPINAAVVGCDEVR